MYGVSLISLFIVAIIVSGILFFILALYKRYAYFWWALSGVAVCVPIVVLVPKLDKIFFGNSNTNENKIILFLSIYLIIYTSLWIFSRRSVISAEAREKKAKMDEAIFEGFFALKGKKVDRAYQIFKEASLVDPDNPVIKVILQSFIQGRYGLIKRNSIFEWRFKVLLYLKGLKGVWRNK